jgi:hypothetical protein
MSRDFALRLTVDLSSSRIWSHRMSIESRHRPSRLTCPFALVKLLDTNHPFSCSDDAGYEPPFCLTVDRCPILLILPGWPTRPRMAVASLSRRCSAV